ncbi:MAG: 50S ribosomal protein L27 [Alphaproteobacteria bacterium]|nr:50S ribosomal protein L27 [Alphaproteobacteria bacterium]
MATKKAGGTSRVLRDSNPQYLGIKIADGAMALLGQIIVRQRGTRFVPGKNTFMGKDHTIHSALQGIVHMCTKRKTSFTGKKVQRVEISVEEKK